jgi:hypothetical protein
MSTKSTRKHGKTLFVKETLIDNPHATVAVVNEAWTSAGMEGTISEALVNKMRAQMGLSGNLRSRGQEENAAGATSRRRADTKPRGNGKQTSARSTERRTDDARVRAGSRDGSDRRVADLEADLDRLLFRVMSLGNLPRVEEAIRATRRALYRAFATKH